MGYTHAGHIDALNQNIAELSDNINVSFEFFPPTLAPADMRAAVEVPPPAPACLAVAIDGLVDHDVPS